MGRPTDRAAPIDSIDGTLDQRKTAKLSRGVESPAEAQPRQGRALGPLSPQALGGASVGSHRRRGPFLPRSPGTPRKERRRPHAVRRYVKTTRRNRRPPLRHLPVVAGRAGDQVHVPAALQGPVRRQRPLPGQGHSLLRRQRLLPLEQVGEAAVGR